METTEFTVLIPEFSLLSLCKTFVIYKTCTGFFSSDAADIHGGKGQATSPTSATDETVVFDWTILRKLRNMKPNKIWKQI